MKKINEYHIIIIIIYLFSGLTCKGQKFSTSEPQTIVTNKQRKELGINLDAGIYAVNDNGQWKWFSSNLWWKVLYCIGPKDNPFDSVAVLRGPFENLPEEHTPDGGDHPWGNCCWIGNVYRNPENGHIFAFTHIEYNAKEGEKDKKGNRKPDYFRFGSAISKDGGESFKWCGYLIDPDISYETWLNYWFPKKRGSGNMGLANYIIKDGYFYLYYTDTKDSPDTLKQGVAVARAKVEDVLAAAENYQVAPWKKYYNGEWNEPGMGGKFTSLNLDVQGFLHGDAAYNSYLDKYVLVTLGRGSILLSFSKDGLKWSDWQTVHKDNHYHVYPSIISTGEDNEVIGKSFWVYYKYYVSELPRIAGEKRWDRILVTME